MQEIISFKESSLSDIYKYFESLELYDLIVFYLTLFIMSSVIKLILKSEVEEVSDFKVNPTIALSLIFICFIGWINQILAHIGISFSNYLEQVAVCVIIFTGALAGVWLTITHFIKKKYSAIKNKIVDSDVDAKKNQYRLKPKIHITIDEDKMEEIFQNNYKSDKPTYDLIFVRTLSTIIAVHFFLDKNRFISLGLIIFGGVLILSDLKKAKSHFENYKRQSFTSYVIPKRK